MMLTDDEDVNNIEVLLGRCEALDHVVFHTLQLFIKREIVGKRLRMTNLPEMCDEIVEVEDRK